MRVEFASSTVFDHEKLVGLGRSVDVNLAVIAVPHPVTRPTLQVDEFVMPVDQIAQISARWRWRTSAVQMVSSTHQAVVAHAGALLEVAVALSVVVDIRESAQKVSSLVTESADSEITLRATHAGKHVEVGLECTVLKLDVVVVRPQLSQVEGLTRVHEVDSVHDALAAGIEIG